MEPPEQRQRRGEKRKRETGLVEGWFGTRKRARYSSQWKTRCGNREGTRKGGGRTSLEWCATKMRRPPDKVGRGTWNLWSWIWEWNPAKRQRKGTRVWRKQDHHDPPPSVCTPAMGGLVVEEIMVDQVEQQPGLLEDLRPTSSVEPLGQPQPQPPQPYYFEYLIYTLTHNYCSKH